MSRLLLFTISCVLLFSGSAEAGCGFLKLLNCERETPTRTNTKDLRSSEISAKGLENAKKSINQFYFEKLRERPKIGYSLVKYSMVDKYDKSYEDKFNNAKEIVHRSIIDWISSIFVTSNKIFVVSLDVFADEDETKLIAHKPIVVIENSDSLKSITEQNSISLNGKLGYPRLSNRPHRVKLSVRYADTDDVTLDNVADLISAANAFNRVVPSVGSLVEESTLAAFNLAKADLEKILGKFQVSTSMSRGLTMRHAPGEVVAFNYDFRAPNETDLPRVKLSVVLTHSESILTEGGLTLPGDILNVQIHSQDDDRIELRKYIQTHDVSSDDVAKLETANPDISTICQQIREALGQRLTAIDQTVALNAFISDQTAKFAKGWSNGNTCYFPNDIKIINQIPGLEPASLWTQEQPATIISLTKGEQIRLVKSFNTIMTKKFPESAHDIIKDGVISNLPDEHAIKLIDEVGIILNSAFTISADELVTQLLRSDKKLERNLGCYSGDQFDTDLQPNVMGTLSIFDGEPIEVLFEFSPAPTTRRRPELDRLIFSRPSDDRLAAYRDGVATRARSGCAGGFKPWKSPGAG